MLPNAYRWPTEAGVPPLSVLPLPAACRMESGEKTLISVRRSEPPGPPPGSPMSTTCPRLRCAVASGVPLSPKMTGVSVTGLEVCLL